MSHAQVRDLCYLAGCISLAIPVKQCLTKRPYHPSGICRSSLLPGVKRIEHEEVCDLQNSHMHVYDIDIFLCVSMRFCYLIVRYCYWIPLGSISIYHYDCNYVTAHLNFICVSDYSCSNTEVHS